jgi:hypothetical protein
MRKRGRVVAREPDVIERPTSIAEKIAILFGYCVSGWMLVKRERVGKDGEGIGLR